MSEPTPGPRRSARNAAKRVAEKVEEVAKAPAAKKTKAAPKTKPTTTKAKAKRDETSAQPAAAENTTKDESKEDETAGDAASTKPAVLSEGDELPNDLPAVTKHTGESVSIQDLVKGSEAGIVIFAYPRASTPGCTTQACLFRDSYASISKKGFSVFGLSGDSPKANTNFHTKQSLGDIVLLCDPAYALHERLGIKKGAKGTIRSTTIIKKEGDKQIIVKKTPSKPTESLEIAKKTVGAE
ncbi:AhpC-TSA-domain-containing protein [Ascodesmis nigricans]|uniref:AhpC-TSA-domain-containing protein n=1 Tax=Ascodesmis nigricans TaxID=341454 RepID=A0A4S2MV25_9PEZI|nr:AhpC-TSA-domain-containing protein [Ascodesmis nigricans]